MYNLAYETVIGRHGLVSHASLLWKIGVQLGDNYREKYVGSFPHTPHLARGKDLVPLVLPTNRWLSPKDTPDLPTDLSTPKNRNLTDQNTDLYPQSTAPTITTITYINREGRQL